MADEFNFTALAVTGISENALAAYTALVVNATQPPEDVIAELSAAGLLEELGDRLAPLSPQAAISTWLAERAQQERRVRDAAARLDALREKSTRRDAPSFLTYLTGEAALTEAFESLVAGALDSVHELIRGPFFEPETLTNFAGQKSALGRGVAYRVVYDADTIGLPVVDSLVQESAALGEQSRICPALPLRMMIVDNTTALIVLPCVVDDTQRIPRAVGIDGLIVRASPLVDILIRIFGQCWDGGTDLNVLMQASELEDQELLGLLAQGLTDAAISRMLGMSVRTVQRRVATIAAQLGVSGRFQLGMEAHRRGLLD